METTEVTQENHNTKTTLQFSNIDPSLRQYFIDLAKSRNVPLYKLFLDIFNNYLNLRFDFDEAESAIMQEAYALAPTSLKRKIKKAALQHAQNIIAAKNQPEHEVDLTTKNSTRAADGRADALMNKIFKHNDAATNWYDKIYLTKTALFDYSAKQKQADSSFISLGKLSIDRCLERNKELIYLHHLEHKLAENHNLEAHCQRLKISKGGN